MKPHGGLFLIDPGQDPVDPADGKSEPSVFGDRLPAETQNKITERIGPKRETGIQEIDMGIVVLMSVFDGVPDRHQVWMQPGI